MRALQQEKQGTLYKLHGQAEIHYQTFVLFADDVTYNTQTGDSTADGHVVLNGGPNDEHVEATHALYNLRTETGHFENVVGTIGIQLRGTGMKFTSANPFAFTGKVVEKMGPDHYVVYSGTVTSCQLPHPKWVFRASRVKVDVGGNADIYNSTFRLRTVPVFYFPFVTHPVQRERQSGLLVPSIGQSSVKGTIIGESVFWAINRSMDLHLGVEDYTARGWSQRGEFRARPSDSSFVDLTYFGVIDRGTGTPKQDQGGENVRLDAEDVFGHFRGVARIDYLSSFVFRLAFNEVFTQAVYSEVKSQAFLSNTTRGTSYNAAVERYQDFESTQNGDVVTILHAPSFEISSVDRQIVRSPFYWSYDVAAEGLSRSQPSFRTGNLVGRFDLSPTVALPLVLRGWSLRPEITLRDTYYTQELSNAFGTAQAISDSVNRKSLETAVEVRPPALDRIFEHPFLRRKWKHVVEPRVVYRYVTGVNNFGSILRFDQRDILTNTNEVEYGVVNRLYAKRVSNGEQKCPTQGMPSLFIGGAPEQRRIPWDTPELLKDVPCAQQPEVREVLSWEVAQKYFIDPTFGGALVPGQRNVFTTTADFTGIAFLTDARRFSPLISRLRVLTSQRSDIEWDLDYDIKKGLINASTVLANYRIGPFTLGAGDAYLRAQGETTTVSVPATPRFNQLRVLFGYGHPNKTGFSAATNVGFDATLNFLQYSAVQAAYNWDCCGISVEFRRFALGSVRNENQFRFNFTLANVGAFGNIRRQDRLF